MFCIDIFVVLDKCKIILQSRYMIYMEIISFNRKIIKMFYAWFKISLTSILFVIGFEDMMFVFVHFVKTYNNHYYKSSSFSERAYRQLAFSQLCRTLQYTDRFCLH